MAKHASFNYAFRSSFLQLGVEQGCDGSLNKEVTFTYYIKNMDIIIMIKIITPSAHYPFTRHIVIDF